MLLIIVSVVLGLRKLFTSSSVSFEVCDAISVASDGVSSIASIVVEYAKAKKQRICPLIDFTENVEVSK